jgi:hypothetical protein
VTAYHALLVLALGLTCYRLTRLVVRDELTRPLRERFLEPALEAGEPHWIAPEVGMVTTERHVPTRRQQAIRELAFLVSCPWCLSVHIAALLWLSQALWPDFTRGLASIGAVAALAGLLLDRDNS